MLKEKTELANAKNEDALRKEQLAEKEETGYYEVGAEIIFGILREENTGWDSLDQDI